MATQQALESLINPILSSMGFSLWGLEWHTSPSTKPHLRVLVEKADGQGVLIDECAHISRRLAVTLDVEDLIHSAYTLEVSSPGMDRPFFTAAQMARFVGEEVQVRLLPQGEGVRRQYKGELTSVEGDTLNILMESEPYTLSFQQVEHARLIPNFSLAFKSREARNDE